MNELKTQKAFTATQKLLYSITGALLTGAMWRARGTHGWGSEWGVFTVGMLLMVMIYAVFKRKSNASYFHIILSSVACMLTVPAWGTLLNQTSGYFESHATDEVFACTPLSGVFILLCLGFGMMPLYMFLLSRLFSNKKYSIVKYIIVFAVFFGVFYLCCATISHPILKFIQPESAEAFANALSQQGIDKSVYSFYMSRFTQINVAKKIPYGRNYFTEIEVIARAVAALVTAVFIRFVFKDKAGAAVTAGGCAAFSVSVTAANIFFVLKNKLGVETHPWLGNAWSFWEYFTGFLAGLILFAILFKINKRFPDTGEKDDILSFLPRFPEKVKDILLCAIVFLFGFGGSLLRPIAVRLDESDVFPIIVYVIGGIILAVLTVLMFTRKLPKLWKADAVGQATVMTPVLFTIHMAVYMFVGYTEECPPHIIEHDAIQFFMLFAVPLFFVFYLVVKRKELFRK